VAPSASKPLAETLAALVELAVIAACIVGFVTIVAWSMLSRIRLHGRGGCAGR
jgi:hypothetical protein